jgi:HAD superfamily hydrolase (TIGR01509 family)
MNLDASRVRALCFDVDGTLSDTDDLYTQKLTGYLPGFLFRDPGRAARRLVMWVESPGNALMGIPDRFGLDDELAALVNWMYRHRRKPWRKYMLVPGVDQMLKHLHGRFPMAVISARDADGTRSFLDHFNLARYFDVIVTSLTAEHTKPYPDPVIYAARKMDVPPEACLMIGDTIVDILAGKSAGAQTVGVLCGFGEERELRQRGANLILPTTPMLTDLFA